MNDSKLAAPNFAAIGANLVFATSNFIPANLGGLGAYDIACNGVASDAGINNGANNAYVAWMSTPTFSASTRLTATGSFERVDGTLFAASKMSLLSGQVRAAPNLDELGRLVIGDSFWTGTTGAGAANGQDCAGWTEAFLPDGGIRFMVRGIANAGPVDWTEGGGNHTCNNTGTRVFCMQNTSNATITPPTIPTAGKRLFRSSPVARPSSVGNADTTCTTQAVAAGLPGTYRALLASSTVSAATNALVDNTVYYRVDGTRVGSGAEIKALAIPFALSAGIWQLANGTYTAPGGAPDMSPIWTGATSVTALAFTTGMTSNCSNWTSSSTTVRLGRAQTAAFNYFDSFGEFGNCISAALFGLYCAQQ